MRSSSSPSPENAPREGRSVLRQAGGGLVHPIPLASVVLLAMNDHWWKQAYPSVLTGKLSDLAGLFFFPLLLEALVEVARALRGSYRGPSMRLLVSMVVLTGISFALMKTTALGVRVYGIGLGALRWPAQAVLSLLREGVLPPLSEPGLVRDPSDLVALLSLFGTLAFGRFRARVPA